jgi:hypothetical protein
MKRLSRVLEVSLLVMLVPFFVGGAAQPAAATCPFGPSVESLVTSPGAASLLKTHVVLSIPALTGGGWTYVAVPELGWGNLDDHWGRPVVVRTMWTQWHFEGARDQILLGACGAGTRLIPDTLGPGDADLLASRFGTPQSTSAASLSIAFAVFRALVWYLLVLVAGGWATLLLLRRGRGREAGVLLIAPVAIATAWLWHPAAWNPLAITIGTATVLLAWLAMGWKRALKWYGWVWVLTAGMGVISPINEALGRLPGFPFEGPEGIGEVATKLAPLGLLFMFVIHAVEFLRHDRVSDGTPEAV